MGQVADLVTRLLLDGSKFDNNIAKSTKQIKNMQRQAEQSEKAFKQGFSMMTGAIGKLAAGVGLTVGAFETFNIAINASADTQRDFKIICDTAKGSVDNFFRSLWNGDDTPFFKRMENIRKSVESTIDFMRNSQVRQILMERYDASIIALKEKADVETDESKKKQYEEQARKISQQALELNKRGMKEYSSFIKNTLNALSSGSAQYFQGEDGFTRLMTLADSSSKERKTIESFEAERNKMFRDAGLMGNINTGKSYAVNGVYYTKDDEKRVAIAKDLEKKYGQSYDYLSKVAILVDGLNEDMITSLQAANDMAGKLQKDATGTLGDWKTVWGKMGKDNFGGTKVDVIPKESIADYQNQLKKANQELENATTLSARIALQKKIDELKEVIRVMNFQAQHPNTPSVPQNTTIIGGLGTKANPSQGLKVHGFGAIYTKSDIETTNEFAESLNAVAQIMGNIQSATNSATGEWVNFAGNLLSSSAGMVTAVNALSEAYAIQAENARLAAAGEAIKSAAMTPFVGWLLVGAAAASVISAFASVPKYASGGIVGGASTVGDLNIARVNSGEMILNGTQQSRLFSLLDGGSPASNGVGGGKVEFKIRAQELIGVLDNHNRKINKLR